MHNSSIGQYKDASSPVKLVKGTKFRRYEDEKDETNEFETKRGSYVGY